MRALVAVDSPTDIDLITGGLHDAGLSVIVGAGAEQACRLATSSDLDVAIVINGATASHELLKVLEERGIPMVFIGQSSQLARAAEVRSVVAGVPLPCDTEDVRRAVQIVVAASAVAGGLDEISVGPLRIEVHSRMVFLGDRRLELPPKAFALLAELASNAGTPVSSSELVRRVWPNGKGITTDDVHRHVYRLRSLLDDHSREPALISNRRGFGYVLTDEETTTGSSAAASS